MIIAMKKKILSLPIQKKDAKQRFSGRRLLMWKVDKEVPRLYLWCHKHGDRILIPDVKKIIITGCIKIFTYNGKNQFLTWTPWRCCRL